MSANYAAEADLRRARLLAATLSHVPFDGWTWRAVARGAADAGYAEAEAHLAFPDGIREVVAAYSAELNRRMEAALAARAVEMRTLKVRERIGLAGGGSNTATLTGNRLLENALVALGVNAGWSIAAIAWRSVAVATSSRPPSASAASWGPIPG